MSWKVFDKIQLTSLKKMMGNFLLCTHRVNIAEWPESESSHSCGSTVRKTHKGDGSKIWWSRRAIKIPQTPEPCLLQKRL